MRVGMIALAAGTASLVMAPSPGTAQRAGGGAWLHVRVEEPGRQSKVSVNLPMGAVEAALKAAPDTVVSAGRIHLGSEGKSVSISDLRRMWAEVRATGDTEFATVEEDDETVRIARAGDVVSIHVDKPSHREAVRVEVPVDVVDALLSASGDQLDIRAAFTRLQKRRGDIVRVNDEHSSVRIWIDEGR